MEEVKNEKVYMSEQDYLIGKGCASVFSDHLKKLVEVDKVFIKDIFTKKEDFAIISIVKYVMIEISNYVDTIIMFEKILETIKKEDKSITEILEESNVLEKIFTEEELMELVKKKDKKSLRFIEIYFDKLSDFEIENNKLINELIIKTLKDKFDDKQILEWLEEKSTEEDEKFLTKSVEYIQQNLDELEKITKLNLFIEINLAREDERKLVSTIYKDIKDIPEEPIITKTKEDEKEESDVLTNIIDAEFVDCKDEEEKSHKVEILELQPGEKEVEQSQQPKEENKPKEETKHTVNHHNKDNKEVTQDKPKDKEPVEQPKEEEKSKQVEQQEEMEKEKKITALLNNNNKLSKRELEKRLRELGLSTAQVKSLIKQQELDEQEQKMLKEIEKSKAEMEKIKENMTDEEKKKLEKEIKEQEEEFLKFKKQQNEDMTDEERRQIFESKLDEDNIFEEAEKEKK